VIERAVHNYFAYKTDLNHREFRNLLRGGRISLVIGLSLLALRLSGAEVLAGLEVPGTKVLQESLTICGWVAMWHPMETYLYRWWPLRREGSLSQAIRSEYCAIVPQGLFGHSPGVERLDVVRNSNLRQ
jgi:hypothetical protein